MKLRTRLGLGIVSITIILLVPLILALRSLDAVHTQTRMLRDKEFAASLLLGNLRSINDAVKESETAVLLTNKPETFARIRKNIGALSATASTFARYIPRETASELTDAVTAL